MYTAVGYSVSNVLMIVGDDDVIIIDTGLDLSGATEIARQFQKITDKPVKAITDASESFDITRFVGSNGRPKEEAGSFCVLLIAYINSSIGWPLLTRCTGRPCGVKSILLGSMPSLR